MRRSLPHTSLEGTIKKPLSSKRNLTLRVGGEPDSPIYLLAHICCRIWSYFAFGLRPRFCVPFPKPIFLAIAERSSEYDGATIG